MAKECLYCGEPIPLSYRILRQDLHPECREKQEAALRAYEQRVRQAGQDRDLSQETRVALTQLAAAGRFTEEQLKEINTRRYATTKDQILTGDFPQSDRDFLQQLQDFLKLSDEEADAEELDQLRHLVWIAEGNLPEIATSVNLKKGEVAHYEGEVTWQHLRTRRKRVAGTRSRSIRVAKGISFKTGSTPGHTEEWQEFQTVDEGRVIVTSQRLLFMGAKKNLNLKHDKILDMELFADAVLIHRGTVNPTYFFMDDPKTFFTVLSTALAAEDG